MKSLKDIKILVVGDIMLDRYVVGDVERISPEAPVPIVNVREQYVTLGGCGNVVRNLRELEVQVDCLASIGLDGDGETIGQELTHIGANSFLFYGNKQTTVKERIIADQRKVQMLRIDREETKSIEPHLPVDILTRMTAGKPEYDIIIVSDYAKGMITSGLMTFLKSEVDARIIVDPKPLNGGIYNGVYMVTPNEKEWASMMFSSAYTLSNVQYILQTKGNKGMSLINNLNEDNPTCAIEAEPVAVYNVSGAGDTVVAVMATCLSMGYDPITSAKIANKCAGYVVTQPGTSVVPKNAFENYSNCVLGYDL